MNKILLVGRLTHDPELMCSGTSEPITFAKFTVAVNRMAKNGEQSADFINCTAFRNTAEFIGKYFKKGMAIGIVGRLQISRYKNKAGDNKTSASVIVETAEFVERKQSNDDSSKSSDDISYVSEESVSDDTLPF